MRIELEKSKVSFSRAALFLPRSSACFITENSQTSRHHLEIGRAFSRFSASAAVLRSTTIRPRATRAPSKLHRTGATLWYTTPEVSNCMLLTAFPASSPGAVGSHFQHFRGPLERCLGLRRSMRGYLYAPRSSLLLLRGSVLLFGAAAAVPQQQRGA